MKIKQLKTLTSTACMALMLATASSAATLRIANDELIGARDVSVDGEFYDVIFIDGTCIDLYNGCDDISDFTFQSLNSAAQASQALLDQVFIVSGGVNYDTDPSLTRGISGQSASIVTPYGLFAPGSVSASRADNGPLENNDTSNNLSRPTTDADFATFDDAVYAVWSVAEFETPATVPLPAGGMMLLSGLFGIAALRRRSSLNG